MTSISTAYSITLFSIVCVMLFVLMLANWIQSFRKVQEKEFSNFLLSNIRRKNDKVRDLVYYKVFRSPKFLVLTRRDALLYVSVMILALYNYIGYMYTKDKGDLISAIVPFTMYGIFETAATHTKEIQGNPTAVFFESFANILFTVSTILACEIIRKTFVVPLYVPLILIIVSVTIQIILLLWRNRFHKNAMKQHADNGMHPRIKAELEKEDVDAITDPANAKWTLDKKTYVVFTYIDIIILFVPLVIIGSCYAAKVAHWQWTIMTLFIAPIVYFGLQISLLVTAGIQGRIIFNIFLSCTSAASILMVLLYSLGVFGSANAEIAIGIPCFFLLSLFLISIVFKNPQTVPLLSVSCVATDNYKNQCVGEIATNVQNGESITILQTSDYENAKIEGRV